MGWLMGLGRTYEVATIALACGLVGGVALFARGTAGGGLRNSLSGEEAESQGGDGGELHLVFGRWLEL